ncbi:MAG: glycosyltransferase [Candidatus Absconditabacterales bacterium]
MLTAFNQFAEVYYSGTRFDPHKKGYGLINYSGFPVTRVTDDYDMYYVRMNPNVFRAIPAGKPKLWFATPYDKYCYQHATAVVTPTEIWAQWLREGKEANHSHLDLPKTPNALSIHQVVGNQFVPLQCSAKTTAIRQSFGGDFIIGYFGQLTSYTYPHALFHLLPHLVKKYPGIRLVLGINTNYVETLPENLPNTTIAKFAYEDMPYVISACDLIVVSQYKSMWDYWGNQKVIEAAACGVPIVLGRSKARTELLGEDYELFLPPLHGPSKWRDTILMQRMIEKTIKDNHFRMQIAQKLPRKAQFYSVSESAKRLQILFEDMCNRCPVTSMSSAVHMGLECG